MKQNFETILKSEFYFNSYDKDLESEKEHWHAQICIFDAVSVGWVQWPYWVRHINMRKLIWKVLPLGGDLLGWNIELE